MSMSPMPHNVPIVQVYAKTSKHEDDETEKFYSIKAALRKDLFEMPRSAQMYTNNGLEW